MQDDDFDAGMGVPDDELIGESGEGDLGDMSGAGDIDHVGMLVGDLNGDTTWDMVHASAPCCGVRVEYSVFESGFWRPHIRGFRTAR